MAIQPKGASLEPSAVSASEIAEAAHATDLFVFRRIGERRFAHIGGVGRGAGWAGIVEVGVDDEPLVEAVSMSDGALVRRSHTEPWHVIGPYYARAVAAVPVSEDVFVVFGSSAEDNAFVSDEDLVELARFASEALVEVAPAKRLADELEALNALRDLLYAPAETFHGALQRLVDHATSALSCDLGLLYIAEPQIVLVSDRRNGLPLVGAEIVDTLAAIARRRPFPLCIQEAVTDELLPPFLSTDGVVAYYVLEVERPLPGLLLLLHTSAAPPRGFTLLCQSLGRRLVEAAEPLLTAALLRDTMEDELERAAAEARRDPLTGLANRLSWSEALSTATASSEAPATVIQLDCRGLKLINDTHGHRVGDEQLRRVAKVLSSSVRANDLVARLGGDEFGILLCDADEELSQTIIERIEEALAADDEPGLLSIKVAIGVSTSRDENLDAAQQRADALMLQSKRHLRPVS